MRIMIEDPENPTGRDIFHAGEREMHRRFGVENLAHEMKDVIAGRLGATNANFMASQPFFFITVREPGGRIFTQMLTCAETAQGVYPLLAFRDAQTFYFLLGETVGAPLLAIVDDAGNRADNHAHSHPHDNTHSNTGCKAGLIFVDFARRARFRVNGSLRIAPDDALQGFECPAHYRLMEVGVEQAYANCPARIVRLKTAE